MRIIVGLDVRPTSQGALHFAQWLTATSRYGDEAVEVLHVLEQDHLALVLRYHHLDEVMAMARTTAATLLAKAGAARWEPGLRVLVGTRAEVDLRSAALAQGDGLLVIGRMAQRGERRLVRLGKVARRLLRAPSTPTVVVPPDLEASDLGAGPVIALSDLEAGSVPAGRFAASMADRLGRPLEVVHVMADPLDAAPTGSSERCWSAPSTRSGAFGRSAWTSGRVSTASSRGPPGSWSARSWARPAPRPGDWRTAARGWVAAVRGGEPAHRAEPRARAGGPRRRAGRRRAGLRSWALSARACAGPR
ncbi:MAG: universal stress protein [Candidatus Moduliflexus flocculans]|nr:universal stress protein [Candidatus Moduliflexus flocculans]